MNPIVESAFISAVATLVGVGGTVVVAVAGFRNSRSTNQATLDVTKGTTDKTVEAARDTNKATIDAAHDDVRRTLDATRDGQIADRYTKAIEQLGSSTIDVTIGGIYALERIARDSPKDHPTVIEVLSACIREHSREQWPVPRSDDDPMARRTTRPDVQAALTVIGRRDAGNDRYPVDLRGAELYGADLDGANLARALFTGAKLIEATLIGAKLNSASLALADLTRADLTRADLTAAYLPGADFTDATLVFADFSRANLLGANFTLADLTDADLNYADLSRSHVAEAILTGTDLIGAEWPRDSPVPEGWTLDPAGRLVAVDTGSGSTEAS